MRPRTRTIQVHFEGEGPERRPASASRKLRMSGRRVLIELEADAREAETLFLLYRKRAVEVVVAGALARESLEALHARLGPEYAIIQVPLLETAD
jgi:hypothetical protein